MVLKIIYRSGYRPSPQAHNTDCEKALKAATVCSCCCLADGHFGCCSMVDDRLVRTEDSLTRTRLRSRLMLADSDSTLPLHLQLHLLMRYCLHRSLLHIRLFFMLFHYKIR